MGRTDIIETDVAIAGGGCGGVAAAVQAARTGARVVLVEETPWLGGMITSAGVVAFDGNAGTLACGIYREIMREIEIHYGGPAKTATGWVTSTAFEPHVTAAILGQLVSREERIQCFLESQVTDLIVEQHGDEGLPLRVSGFRFKSKFGELEVRAKVVIDATEYGDLIDMAGIPFRLGRESREETGEPDAPEIPDNEIQDVTYVAILKDWMATEGVNAPPAPASEDYDPSMFRGATAIDANDASPHNHELHTWETFIDYGKLPNNKCMINWPFHANDFPDGLACFDRARRAEAYQRAKAHTLNFVHYIQTVLGHPELGVARDEFPTDDGLPFIPYIRESRRIIGDVVMCEQDVLPGCGNGMRPPLRKESIAVGDYFLDHHHARAHPGHPDYFHEVYPANAKFQVPFGVFFPRGVDGFMAIEKSISVTHIVNGCTRLQPIVLLMGQAAGAIAAQAARSDLEPRAVPVRDVQEYLLVRGVMLYPYEDLPGDDRIFVEAQKLALAGAVFDNEDFFFHRDQPVTWDQAAELLVKAKGGPIPCEGETPEKYRRELRALEQDIEGIDFSDESAYSQTVTRATLAPVLCMAMQLHPEHEVRIRFLDMPHTHWAAKWIEPLYRKNLYEAIWLVNFEPDRPVTRAELTLMLDRAFDPFRRLPL